MLAFSTACSSVSKKTTPTSANLEIPTTSGKIHKYHGFSLEFDSQNRVPKWVGYELTPDKVKSKTVERDDSFKIDPKVPGSPGPKDYAKSGYDQGHLTPAEDMRWSKESMQDSFYMTNMAPQAAGFNRGIWKKLEIQVRKWAAQSDSAYIVTGPVIAKGCIEKIKQTICAPKEFFKVILIKSKDRLQAFGFIIPQKYENKELDSYKTSVDEVEKQTNLDFFPGISESIEASIN